MPTPHEIVARLTLEEKASLLSGQDFWHTQAIEGVAESVMLTDGPHGLRKQGGAGDHLGIGDSRPATCFPPAVALAASFDVDLVHEVGARIAAEARAEDVAVVLGPGINLKRSPLCGRNFEYFSEDPWLSGAMGRAWVEGVQSGGVGASLKHFAVNNQETDRLRVSADVDERPLRELYLRAFEHVVTHAAPWTVMCSYNRINGVHASQNHWLLSTVLREEWGYRGLVVSDWGAVKDRIAALRAGLDLEMPGNGGVTDAELVAAVAAGRLDEAELDRAAARVVELVRRVPRPGTETRSLSEIHAENHAAAREIAARCVVLLRNEPVDDTPLLPLAPDQRVALIGEFARSPRYQGAGSSRINPTRLEDALSELSALHADVGFAGDDLTEAVALARDADVAVVFLGLPAEAESEGFDRTTLALPADQIALLEAVLAVQPRTVVVFSGGGVVTLPFASRVPAIVGGFLLGQASGGALADVLTGRVNPSGRLAETMPLRLTDTPAYLDFPGERGHIRYSEGVFVGYRWYDARELDVAFPFGHGLSYTTFDHDDLLVSGDPNGFTVKVLVTNTGTRSGRDVVQVYVGKPGSQLARAPRELAGVAIVDLEPGESTVAEVRIPTSALAAWFTGRGWAVEDGEYHVAVGSSSRDLYGHTHVSIAGDDLREPLHLESTIAEVLADPVAGPLVAAGLADAAGSDGADDVEGVGQMMLSFPIGRVVKMAGGGVSLDDIQALLDAANAERR
ncbi:glycoside hydrolase family 3 C-terminal domain-containing protein [Nocardioides sp. Bht2]|uniref:glycoside hydrolase family 3 C-terminal domain-containing protein n=1 Tax=Nocardioides sp. Bht2 TaxID=3392297 RepID=UPI0039B58B6D